jgi:hypothetical protein
MKELQRIPITLDHLHLVWHYGQIRGMETIIKKMNYTDTERKQVLKMLYEINIKPTADFVRSVLGTDKAITFDPFFMEFVIYDVGPDQVDYDTATEHWEKEYGRKYTESKEVTKCTSNQPPSQE